MISPWQPGGSFSGRHRRSRRAGSSGSPAALAVRAAGQAAGATRRARPAARRERHGPDQRRHQERERRGAARPRARDRRVGRAARAARHDQRRRRQYALSDLPAGSYIVSVTRTGYAPQIYATGPRRHVRRRSSSPNAQQAANVDFALVPGGYIAGRILDEDGTPFAGAEVDALVTRIENGADTLFSVSTAQTDDRGEFRLFGLAPGQYYVSAGDPAFRAVSTPKGVVPLLADLLPRRPLRRPGATPWLLTGTGRRAARGVPAEARAAGARRRATPDSRQPADVQRARSS